MAGFMSGMGELFNYAVNSLDMTSSANDIIVVQHQDGSLHSSPFIVRFGKVKVLRPQDKVVTIEVNNHPTSAVMKIASDGTAYWVHGVADAHRGPHDVESPLDSPLPQSPVVLPQSPGESGEMPPLRFNESDRRPAKEDPSKRGGMAESASGSTTGQPQAAADMPDGDSSRSGSADTRSGSPLADRPDEKHRPPPDDLVPQAALDVKRLDDADPEELLTTQNKGQVEHILTSLAAEAAVSPNMSGMHAPSPGGAAGAPTGMAEAPPALGADPSTADYSADFTPGGGLGRLRLARLASADALDHLPLGHLSLRGAAGGDDHDDAADASHSSNSNEGADALRRALHADPNAAHAVEMVSEAAQTGKGKIDESDLLARGESIESGYGGIGDDTSNPLHADHAPRDDPDATPTAKPAEAAEVHAHEEHLPKTEDLRKAGEVGKNVNEQVSNVEDAFSDSEEDEIFPTPEGVHGAADAIAMPTGRLSADGPAFTRSVFATHHDLTRLNLKPGANTIRFSTGTTLRGRVDVTATVFLWSENAKLVVSDVDGTVTKSDVMGHIATFFGRDWTHPGLCALYSKIAKNGYHFVYLTARSVSQVDQTRQLINNVEQDGVRLPQGPVLTAPEKLFSALQQELSKKSHEFKIACLAQVRDAFPMHVKPFYAGFGNRIGDVVAYTASQISEHKIFIINQDSVIHICSVKRSYRDLSHLVDETFPARKLDDDYLTEYHELRNAAHAFNSGGSGAASSPSGRSSDPTTLPTTATDAALASFVERSASPGSEASFHSGAGNGPSSPHGGLGSTLRNRTAPPIADAQPEFNDFNFWRVDPAAMIEPPKPAKKPDSTGVSPSASTEGVPASPPDRRPRSESPSKRGWLSGLWGSRKSTSSAAASPASAPPSTPSTASQPPAK